MRARGQKYWTWASTDLHIRNHDERLSDRTLINVQVRHCAQEGTQLFIGVYGDNGAMLLEEIYESRPGETMTQATAWGVERAKQLIGKPSAAKGLKLPPEPLPRKNPRTPK